MTRYLSPLLTNGSAYHPVPLFEGQPSSLWTKAKRRYEESVVFEGVRRTRRVYG